KERKEFLEKQKRLRKKRQLRKEQKVEKKLQKKVSLQNAKEAKEDKEKVIPITKWEERQNYQHFLKRQENHRISASQRIRELLEQSKKKKQKRNNPIKKRN
ncbi:hypothetical protein RFI_35080, partial [Reticulomyxa filosa]